MGDLFQFDEATHSYLFGEMRERVPSVTQILNGVGIVDYSYIPPAVLKHAADRGTAAHSCCEALLQGDLDWEAMKSHPLLVEAEPYVRGCEKFLKDTGFVADAGMIEHQGIHTINGMRYGYRWDACGVLFKQNVLLDFKCTASVQKHWGVQTAAYELPARAVDGKVRARFVLHLNKRGGYQLVETKSLDDYRVFQWALGVESWKQTQKGKSYGNECPVDVAE